MAGRDKWGAKDWAAAGKPDLSFSLRPIVSTMPRDVGRPSGTREGEATAARRKPNNQKNPESMADQKLPPGAEYEQATPWLTDVHPDDVVASGEGFDAWLISVTHGYVDVDRLKTVASMIPVLNNLMALADALTLRGR
ncbi:hypothetical protein [Burkholderia cenocepacia]|uniref:hypothetical protein n=1 Tax=Burkholderia cenocepacia TaxID=95486 RepID=UPI001CF2406F|nr:hypothetical protein [Burkholderia cenocepacia]